MQPGTISSWVAVGITIGIIVAGQVILWVKFKTKVDTKFESSDKQVIQHEKRHEKLDTQVDTIKETIKDYITLRDYERFQSAERTTVADKIHRVERDAEDTKKELKGMANDVIETKSMVAQLLALQTGKVS